MLFYNGETAISKVVPAASGSFFDLPKSRVPGGIDAKNKVIKKSYILRKPSFCHGKTTILKVARVALGSLFDVSKSRVHGGIDEKNMGTISEEF